MSDTFAVIDIGTNSIRSAVVRTDPGGGHTVVSRHREVVRLGEGEFETKRMSPEAIALGASVCARFAEAARGAGATEIIALATSATREAENRDEFIDRIRREARVEAHVISGVEEARLIWLGVTSAIDLEQRRALVIDIGGGSTEVIVGTANETEVLESLRLGAIRLSNRSFQGSGAVPWPEFEKVAEWVGGRAAQTTRRVVRAGYDLAIGSAGTITTLADIAGRRAGLPPLAAQRQPMLGATELEEVLQLLCGLSLEERRRVPGMDDRRADIILGGGAVLLGLVRAFRVEKLQVSDRGLRDGIVLDHVLREETAREHYETMSVRRRSILHLAHACGFEQQHAEHTTMLALSLFDELRALGAHGYGDVERELLEYAALLHDIGMFLSHANHHRHAWYLIRNADLLGFDDREIDLIANVALFHRKGTPRKRHPTLAHLSAPDRRIVTVLAAILRLAEGLDRGHLGAIASVSVTRAARPRRYVLQLTARANCDLELWGVANTRDLFEVAFGAPLETAEPVPAAAA